MSRPFIPSDEHVRSVMDRLVKDQGTITSYDTAKHMSKYKQIRHMRQKDLIYIGMDRKKKVSVIFVKQPLKKKGKGFLP